MSMMSSSCAVPPPWYCCSASDTSSCGLALTGRTQPPAPPLTISRPATHRPDIFRELARHTIRLPPGVPIGCAPPCRRPDVRLSPNVHFLRLRDYMNDSPGLAAARTAELPPARPARRPTAPEIPAESR